MISRLIGAVFFVVLLAAVRASAQDPGADLGKQIDALSAFDYPTRMNAARMIRRTSAPEAFRALARAARMHTDQFVRYRALVLLSAFNDPGTGAIMREFLGDRNDRMREVAYRWFERHPEPALHDTLLAALNTEQAEFVRPALIRALAAHADTRIVQLALMTEVGRGLDFFRSAVIEALGEHRATYAVQALIPIVGLDGPLQDDAVLALGRIRDPAAAGVFATAKVSPEAAPSLQAAQCLLGSNCAERVEWLVTTSRDETRAVISKSSVAMLGVLAAEGQAGAIDGLFTLDRTVDRLHGDVAISLATMALRQPQATVAWLSTTQADRRTRAIELLHEGFESLEEDFAEEQFYAAARAAYWAAPEASDRRTVSATLIDKLEF